MHLIQSHQTRPSDDPIFALNKEATERRKKGESIVNATVGALLHDDGKLAVMPTAAEGEDDHEHQVEFPSDPHARGPEYTGLAPRSRAQNAARGGSAAGSHFTEIRRRASVVSR